MTITGGCLCGQVRYQVETEPLWICHCHCGMCRKHTGAPLASFVGFQRVLSDGWATSRHAIAPQRMWSGAFAKLAAARLDFTARAKRPERPLVTQSGH